MKHIRVHDWMEAGVHFTKSFNFLCIISFQVARHETNWNDNSQSERGTHKIEAGGGARVTQHRVLARGTWGEIIKIIRIKQIVSLCKRLLSQVVYIHGFNIYFIMLWSSVWVPECYSSCLSFLWAMRVKEILHHNILPFSVYYLIPFIASYLHFLFPPPC